MSVDKARLRASILDALDPNGATIKLAEIVGGVELDLGFRPLGLYGEVCNLMQTLKREGLVEYVRGKGSGWRRVLAAGGTP